MNIMPQEDHETDDTVFASVVSLCGSLNSATSYLAQGDNDAGFAHMMNVMKALAVFLHLSADSKAIVYTQEEEPCVVPFPMKTCALEDRNSLGGPGQVFPYPFIVTPLPRRANVGSLLSSLSAVAAYNMGIACHRESLVPADYCRCEQFRQQAMQFYKMAYELLDRLSYISPDGTLIHVYMALCTNMAEIQFGQGDLDASREWRSALSDTMGCVPEDKSSVVYKHFYNTSILYRFETPAAQAA